MHLLVLVHRWDVETPYLFEGLGQGNHHVHLNIVPPILCNTYTYAAWQSMTFTLPPLGLT